jgi:hypothetical protein
MVIFMGAQGMPASMAAFGEMPKRAFSHAFRPGSGKAWACIGELGAHGANAAFGIDAQGLEKRPAPWLWHAFLHGQRKPS